MNRRNFLVSAGSSAAVAATCGMSKRAFGQAPSSGPIYTSSTSVGSLTAGNMIIGTPSGTDWTAYRNTLISVANDWQGNNYDSQLESYYASLTPSVIKSSNLNQSQILQNIQATAPSVTLEALQSGWAVADAKDPTTVQLVINALQDDGLIPYLNTAMQQAALLAEASNSANAVAKNPLGSTPAIRPAPINPTGPGGYCENASFAVDALTLAFIVVGVMSGVGAIAEGASWALISAWGGTASGVYGIANRIFC
jgi:hypothetical protein